MWLLCFNYDVRGSSNPWRRAGWQRLHCSRWFVHTKMKRWDPDEVITLHVTNEKASRSAQRKIYWGCAAQALFLLICCKLMGPCQDASAWDTASHSTTVSRPAMGQEHCQGAALLARLQVSCKINLSWLMVFPTVSGSVTSCLNNSV